jgi:hypothetical protein
MGTEVIGKCKCGYEGSAGIGSSRAMHGKKFSFPCYCKDCHQITSADMLAETQTCRHCDSTSLVSYETKSIKVPNELLEKLGSAILHKRGYHLSEEELSPTYCYVQNKTYVMLRWGNHCPNCDGNELAFRMGILYD